MTRSQLIAIYSARYREQLTVHEHSTICGIIYDGRIPFIFVIVHLFELKRLKTYGNRSLALVYHLYTGLPGADPGICMGGGLSL